MQLHLRNRPSGLFTGILAAQGRGATATTIVCPAHAIEEQVVRRDTVERDTSAGIDARGTADRDTRGNRIQLAPAQALCLFGVRCRLCCFIGGVPAPAASNDSKAHHRVRQPFRPLEIRLHSQLSFYAAMRVLRSQ